jgi:hypothetical protein
MNADLFCEICILISEHPCRQAGAEKKSNGVRIALVSADMKRLEKPMYMKCLPGLLIMIPSIVITPNPGITSYIAMSSLH